ncbi:MAG: hypothetical protein LBT75_03535, partial [Bacilli bacterium]|nr:hypothetical protein [Bacilli bacterium]
MNRKNKLTSFLLILGICLLGEVLASSNIKAATYQVNNFASLKSTIESAPAGTHDVEMTADFDFTGPAITIPSNVSINLHSDSTRHTLRRGSTYLNIFFNITNSNTSLNVTNLIIDGQKDTMSANPSGTLFNLGSGNLRVLTIGKDVIIRNHKKIYSGMVVDNDGGILNIKDNAEICDNVQLDNTAGLFNLGGVDAIANISDDVLLHDNYYSPTAATTSAIIIVNYGTVNISGNVKIYNNGGSSSVTGKSIYNQYTGTINFSDNVEFYNNITATGSPITNRGEIYAKDHVKFHDNKGSVGGVFGLNMYNTFPTIINLLELSGDVEIYNNEATQNGGAIIVGEEYRSDTMLVPHQLHITDNVKIYNNKANGNGGAIFVQSPTTNVLIDGSTKIYNNEATSNGGAILFTFESHGIIKDNATIYDNKALNDGGGIYINSNMVTPVQILDKVSITNNEAIKDGGGIFTDAYEYLKVGQDVLFNNNKAIVGYNENLPVIDPTNYAIYQTNVLVPNNKW